MDGTVRKNTKMGKKVMVVQKQDQRTGKLTEGIVQRILTNSQNHPRGIKVMLNSGIVGRVQTVIDCKWKVDNLIYLRDKRNFKNILSKLDIFEQ